MNRYNQDSAKDVEEPYRRAFNSINKDGSGQVSAQELRAAIQQFLGPNILSEVRHTGHKKKSRLIGIQNLGTRLEGPQSPVDPLQSALLLPWLFFSYIFDHVLL